MTDDTLQRFFQALVDALGERNPADLSGPFTVAEIYQDLVPYRTHRDVLGFEMNGDYEHALLQLLAGREGYLELESEHALEEIRSELDGKNPDTSLYRDFAAVDVRIAPGMVPPAPESGSAADDASAPDEADVEHAPEGSDGDAESPEPDTDADEDPETAEEPETSEKPDIEDAESDSSTSAASDVADGICPWCRSDLPAHDGLRFCPFCGEDQSRAPCSSCGEALEPGWEFCVSCGEKKGR